MTSLDLLMAVGGLALLLGGGEFLLRGAVALAMRFGLSPLLIGLTVVAAATSMPELIVAVTSGLAGVPDLGVGNAVGSNIANVLLVLGATALAWPIATRPHHILRDGMSVVAATILFIIFGYLGEIGRIHGVVMLACLCAYLAYSYKSERRRDLAERRAVEAAAESASESAAETPKRPQPVVVSLGLLVLGVGALALGSHWLVEGAVAIARFIGVSEAVIGLTMVAVGTSLPELATAIVAGIRRHSEIALGNVLGSNLFNILAILASLALVTPFEVAPQLLRLDVWVMAVTSILLLPVMFTGWRIGRREGAAFLIAYFAYVAVLYGPVAAAG
jgi:cation:H+ antiporter